MKRVRPNFEKNHAVKTIKAAPEKNYSNSVISGVILLLFDLFTTISVFSYDAYDSCLNVAGDQPIKNIGGYYGATVADALLQLFGFGVSVLIIMLLVWSITLFIKRYISLLWLRIPSLLIAMFSICIVLSLFSGYNFTFQMLPGGYIGMYLLHIFSESIGSIITALSALLTFVITFYFCVGITTKSIARITSATRSVTNFLNKFWKIVKIILNIITLKFIYDLIKHRKQTFFFIKEILGFNSKKNKKPVIAAENLVKPPEKQINLEPHNAIPQKTQKEPKGYQRPSTELLNKFESENITHSKQEIEQKVKQLLAVLNEFGVKGNIINYTLGPVVTSFELQPKAGTKSSRVTGLAADIARSMSAMSTRISPIQGKDVISIELPNHKRQKVSLRQILESAAYVNSPAILPLVLGKSTTGEPIITDLTRMPHLLIAGTTGSGKSIGMNTMILSMLYKLSPDECRLIMIDPKMLEFSLYEGIPHLLSPVITDPLKAISALKWVVKEMTKRYKLMSNVGVRNIGGYNEKVAVAKIRGGQIVREIETAYNPETGEMIAEKVVIDAKNMPHIVVIIDEVADLMLVAGKEIDILVQRLAQMARAAGIHIIMATQRPSVDVITGVIKANFPTRISYQVTSKIDSRTILGEQGAEQLIGQGDMLYMPIGGRLSRIHGAFVSDEEIEKIVKYLKSVAQPEYVDINYVEEDENTDSSGEYVENSSDDASLYAQAKRIVLEDKKTSISYVQRKLRIGYNKAANLIEMMEKEGVLSEADHTGRRQIISVR